jgi:hypothetical protein
MPAAVLAFLPRRSMPYTITHVYTRPQALTIVKAVADSNAVLPCLRLRVCANKLADDSTTHNQALDEAAAADT